MQTNSEENDVLHKLCQWTKSVLRAAPESWFDSNNLKPGHALVTPLVAYDRPEQITLKSITAQPLSFFRRFPNLYSNDSFRKAFTSKQPAGDRKSVFLVIVALKGIHVLHRWNRMCIMRKKDCESMLSWMSAPGSPSVKSFAQACGPEIAHLIANNPDPMAYLVGTTEAVAGRPDPLDTLIDGFLPGDLKVSDAVAYRAIRQDCIDAIKKLRATPELVMMETDQAYLVLMNIFWGFQSQVIHKLFGGDGERFRALVKETAGASKFRDKADKSFSETQRLLAVRGKLLTRKCAWCGGQGVQLKRCSRCRSVFYCGSKCQRSGWKQGHRVVCKTV